MPLPVATKNNQVTQVPVKADYVQLFEQLSIPFEEALHHYALQKIQHRLFETEQKLKRWEEKYGCSYDLFAYRTATDGAYVHGLEREPTQMDWEGDLLMWEIDAAELKKWRTFMDKL